MRSRWLLSVFVGWSGLLGIGCASAPPCRCVCETCAVAAAHAEGAPARSPAAAPTDTRAAPPREKTVGRAGEALTEQQLLQRYEGKRASKVLQGKATYYANSLAGRKTASGEPYDPTVFSAAHRTLPFGTVVRVIRTDTNRYVYVRITDRGPFAGGGRIIDLSYVAAERLGMIRAGVVPVRIEVLN